MDRGLIAQESRGLSVKLAGIFQCNLVFNRKSWLTRSTTHGPLEAPVHGALWPWPVEELARAWPRGRSVARWLAGDGAMERVEHKESLSGLTGAWVMAW
jgi:hypothetical protein